MGCSASIEIEYGKLCSVNEAVSAAARELVERYGAETALKVAGERAAGLERRAEWKEHATAMLVLNELERLRRCG